MVRLSITRRGLLATVFAALLQLPFWIQPATAAPAGSVVGLSGECFAETGGQRRPLKLGASVEIGDTVDVAATGKLKLRMTDGSIVSVASGSRMSVGAFQTDAAGQRQNAQLSLAQGLVRAVVTPSGSSGNFEVVTAIGTAAVRSTDLFVEVAPGAMQVGVLTGAVAMTSFATRRAVQIPARWGARLEAGRDPVPARVWSPAEFEAVIRRTDVN
jgi:hypothetical protein